PSRQYGLGEYLESFGGLPPCRSGTAGRLSAEAATAAPAATAPGSSGPPEGRPPAPRGSGSPELRVVAAPAGIALPLPSARATPPPTASPVRRSPGGSRGRPGGPAARPGGPGSGAARAVAAGRAGRAPGPPRGQPPPGRTGPAPPETGPRGRRRPRARRWGRRASSDRRGPGTAGAG